jgi:hypothetical protein
MKKRLDMAEHNVERAETEVDKLKRTPLTPEPSAWEEIERARRFIPNTRPPKKGKIHRVEPPAYGMVFNRKYRARTICRHQG